MPSKWTDRGCVEDQPQRFAIRGEEIISSGFFRIALRLVLREHSRGPIFEASLEMLS